MGAGRIRRKGTIMRQKNNEFSADRMDEALSLLESKAVIASPITTPDGRLVNNHKLLYTDDMAFSTVMRDTYTVVQHHDYFGGIINSFSNIGYDNYRVSMKMNLEGIQNQFSANIILPELSLNEDGSDVFACLTFSNSIDGSMPLIVDFGFFREICKNGMAINKTELLSVTRKHTGVISNFNIEMAMDKMVAYKEEFKLFMEMLKVKRVNSKLIDQVIKLGFPKKLIDKEHMTINIEKYNLNNNEQITNKVNSAWNLYQYLTNWLANYQSNISLSKSTAMNRGLYELLSNVA